MKKIILEYSLSLLFVFVFSSKSFSQIADTYSTLLLKPGHICLSSAQIELSQKRVSVSKGVLLKKNTHYAFSIWTEKKFRDNVSMNLLYPNDSKAACLNPAFETSNGIRYFYYTPKKQELFYIEVRLNDFNSAEKVYVTEGLFLTSPEVITKNKDKKYNSPYCN